MAPGPEMDAIRKEYGEEYTPERYRQMIKNTMYRIDYSAVLADPKTEILPNTDYQAWRKAAEICGFSPQESIDVESVAAVNMKRM